MLNPTDSRPSQDAAISFRSAFRARTSKTPIQGGEAADPSQGVTAANRIWLKRLFWLYFLLLVFEGALRKWILPQFAGPLLVIRDPVALLIYGCAWQQGLRVAHRHWPMLIALIVATALLCLVQLLVLEVPGTVLLYGLRSNFLHLPLIFILPMALSRDDLVQLGKWVLLLCIPFSALMVAQFQAPPDAWINRAAGLSDGQQLPSALGRIRPPATFSFITGAVSYFSLATAFLLYGLRGAKYPPWLLVGASSAILLAGAVSGSRAFVLSAGLVLAFWLLGLATARRSQAQLSRMLVVVAVALVLLNHVEAFHEGTRVLSVRWQSASQTEEPEGGLPARILRSLLSPTQALVGTPLHGLGLGVGTNVGARMLTGRHQFLLSEEEWGRLVLEMGPVLGLAFILWRLTLAISLGRSSIRCAAEGSILPLLLFGSCASHLLTGQLHQSTTQGFTALLTGLCWAAVCTAAPPSEPGPTTRSFRQFRPGATPTGRG